MFDKPGGMCAIVEGSRDAYIGVLNGWGGQSPRHKCQNVLLSTLQTLSRCCRLSHTKLAWHSIAVFSLHSSCFVAFATHWPCSAGTSDSTFSSFLFSLFCLALYLGFVGTVLYCLRSLTLVWNNETASATAVNYIPKLFVYLSMTDVYITESST